MRRGQNPAYRPSSGIFCECASRERRCAALMPASSGVACRNENAPRDGRGGCVFSIALCCGDFLEAGGRSEHRLAAAERCRGWQLAGCAIAMLAATGCVAGLLIGSDGRELRSVGIKSCSITCSSFEMQSLFMLVRRS